MSVKTRSIYNEPLTRAENASYGGGCMRNCQCHSLENGSYGEKPLSSTQPGTEVGSEYAAMRSGAPTTYSGSDLPLTCCHTRGSRLPVPLKAAGFATGVAPTRTTSSSALRASSAVPLSSSAGGAAGRRDKYRSASGSRSTRASSNWHSSQWLTLQNSPIGPALMEVIRRKQLRSSSLGRRGVQSPSGLTKSPSRKEQQPADLRDTSDTGYPQSRPFPAPSYPATSYPLTSYPITSYPITSYPATAPQLQNREHAQPSAAPLSTSLSPLEMPLETLPAVGNVLPVEAEQPLVALPSVAPGTELRRYMSERQVRVPVRRVIEEVVNSPQVLREVILREDVEDHVEQCRETIVHVAKPQPALPTVQLDMPPPQHAPLEKRITEKINLVKVPVRYNVETPLPEVATKRTECVVPRILPSPVRLVSAVEIKVPRLVTVHERVTYPVFVPVFTEIAIPSDMLRPSCARNCKELGTRVESMLAEARTSSMALSEIETLGVEVKDWAESLQTEIDQSRPGWKKRLRHRWAKGQLAVHDETGVLRGAGEASTDLSTRATSAASESDLTLSA